MQKTVLDPRILHQYLERDLLLLEEELKVSLKTNANTKQILATIGRRATNAGPGQLKNPNCLNHELLLRDKQKLSTAGRSGTWRVIPLWKRCAGMVEN